MAVVLVTGANGFIGSHLVAELLQRPEKHEVIALVRPTSNLSSLVPLFRSHGDRLRLVLGDVREPAGFAKALAQAEYVYHLAGVVVGTTRKDYWDTNAEGTRSLVKHLLDHRHHHLHRFLLTSSQAAAGPSVDETPLDETAPRQPIGWYGESKAEAENIVNAAAGEPHKLSVSIVRPVVVYGEREMDLSRTIFPWVSLGFLSWFSLGLRPRIGFRSKTLTMVYVGDLVKGMIAVAEGARSLGRTYFLADPQPNLDADVTDAAAKAFGRKLFPIPFFWPMVLLGLLAPVCEWLSLFTRQRPMVTRDRLRLVRPRFTAATPARALHELGWSAKVILTDGMKRAALDWQQRELAKPQAERLPVRDRKIMTYTLAVILGVIVEGAALIGGWYKYDPWWLVFIIIVAGFGAVMGTLTYALCRRSLVLQFLAGAAVGFGAEALNGLWLHWWQFTKIMGWLPHLLWTRALVVGIPAGLLPIVITAALRSLQGRRLRIG